MNMKTLIAVPCLDTVPVGFAQSLLHLIKGENTSVFFNASSLVYDSRNQIAIYAIEQAFDRVMWFDSDMMFTPQTMQMLSADMDNTPCEMVTGLYFKRKKPYTPVIMRELDEPTSDESGRLVANVHSFTDYPRDTLFPVKGCGFGCCMTSVKLLKDVWDHFGPVFSPYPWAGEDLSFCHRVNQIGHTIWCDSNVICGHIGTYVYTEKFYQNIPKE